MHDIKFIKCAKCRVNYASSGSDVCSLCQSVEGANAQSQKNNYWLGTDDEPSLWTEVSVAIVLIVIFLIILRWL